MTTDTTPTTTAATAADEISKLKEKANAALQEEFKAIAEAARHEDGSAISLRLERHNAMADLVGHAAWLANNLVDVLLKIGNGEEPIGVMRSDLARRILEAEVRLELLRNLSR